MEATGDAFRSRWADFAHRGFAGGAWPAPETRDGDPHARLAGPDLAASSAPPAAAAGYALSRRLYCNAAEVRAELLAACPADGPVGAPRAPRRARAAARGLSGGVIRAF